MALNQYESIITFDEVPDDWKSFVIDQLLEQLQLVIVAEDKGPKATEAGVETFYDIRRRADVDDEASANP